MSSISLPAGWGLGGAGDILCLVVGGAGPRRSRRCPLPRCWRRGASAEQGLIGAGIVPCLILGLAKQRLARFIGLFVGVASATRMQYR